MNNPVAVALEFTAVVRRRFLVQASPASGVCCSINGESGLVVI
jgi:hypothetical protein